MSRFRKRNGYLFFGDSRNFFHQKFKTHPCDVKNIMMITYYLVVHISKKHMTPWITKLFCKQKKHQKVFLLNIAKRDSNEIKIASSFSKALKSTDFYDRAKLTLYGILCCCCLCGITSV